MAIVDGVVRWQPNAQCGWAPTWPTLEIAESAYPVGQGAHGHVGVGCQQVEGVRAAWVEMEFGGDTRIYQQPGVRQILLTEDIETPTSM